MKDFFKYRLLFFCLFFIASLFKLEAQCNLICNSDFEDYNIGSGILLIDQSLVPCWKTTDSQLEIEIWRTSSNSVPPFSGKQFIELNANSAATLYQDFMATPGTSLSISFAHLGRSGTDVLKVEIGPVGGPYTSLGNFSDGNTAWGYYTVGTILPAGSNYRLQFTAVSSAGGDNSFGNFLDAISITGPNSSTFSLSSMPSCNTYSTGSAQVTYTTANTPVSYTWSPYGGSGATANNLSTGNYSVKILESNGCMYTKTVNIGSNPNPTVTVSNATICTGNSKQLSASGANTYVWSTSENTASITVNPTATTIYSVTGATNGCIQTKTLTVSVTPNPTLTVNSPTVCSGNSTTLTVSGATTYTWNTGATSTSITFTPTSSLVYTVTGTKNGCKNTKTVDVSFVNSPTLAVSNQTICRGSSADLETSGANSYSWNPGGAITSSIVVTPSVTTIYTVTGNSNSCLAKKTLTVTVGVIPSISVSVTGTLSCSTTTVTLNSSVPNLSYTWSPPITGSVVNPNNQNTTASGHGTYTLTATTATSGCIYTTTLAVKANTVIPTTIISVSNTLTCLTKTVSLNSSLAGMNYTWTAPPSFSVTNNSIQNTIANGPGVYTLTVKNPTTNCYYSTTASVEQNTLTPLINVTNHTITCITPTVSLTGTVTPGNTTIKWTGLNICGSNTIISTYACSAGIYSLTATEPTSRCSATSTLQVFSNKTAPVISVNQFTNAITCTNTLVAVSATSTLTSLSYTWSGVGILSGVNSPTVTVSQGGNYTYSVTNSENGCSSSATVAVTQNTATPFTNIVVSGTLSCSSPTISLTASNPNLTYTWTPPLSATVSPTNTQTISVNSGGIYSLTVTSPTNGCIYTTTASVTQYSTVPTSSISVSGTLTCLSNSVNLTSSLSGMSYTWTAPSTGNVLNPSSQNTSVQGAGIYTLTVKHPVSFCLFSTQAEVLDNVKTPTIVIGINPTLTCLSPTVSLTSSVSPTDAIINWKGINVCGTSTNVSTYACTAGIYTVTATDAESNCVTTKTLQVFSNELAPVISVNQFTNAITCTNTLVAVSATSTLTSLSYTWSGVGILSGVNSPTVTVSQGGNYTYSVTNNDNGCSSSATVAVTQNTATPFTNIVVKGILSCSSSTVSLTASNPNLTYTWTPPLSATVSPTNTQTISVNSGGIYTLTVTSPTNGCIYTTTASVTQHTTLPTSSISVSGTLTCLSNSVNLTSSLSGMSYTWTAPSTGNVLNPSSQNTSVQGAGIYTLTVKHPVSFCLFSTQAEVLDNVKTPTIVIGINPTLTCLSPTVSLTSSVSPTDALINWKGINVCGTSTNVSTYACTAGIYTITATDAESNCVSTKTLQVFSDKVAPVISINQYSNTLTCTHTVIVTSLTSTLTTLTYTWSGIGITSGMHTPTVTIIQGGTYNYSVTNTGNGCITSGSLAIQQNTATPVTIASVNGTLTCSTSTVNLLSTVPNLSYTWSAPPTASLTNTGTQNTIGNTAGIYTLTVKNPTTACFYVTTTEVFENIITPTISALSHQTITCSSPSVSLTSSVSPTNSVIKWYGPTICGTNTTTSTFGCSPGIYSLTATHPINSCASSATLEVFSNKESITVAVNPPTHSLTCTHTLVTVSIKSITPSYTYTWSGPGILGGTNSPTVSVNESGTYSYSVTDTNNGCGGTGTVSVAQNTVIPTTTISVNGILTCVTSSISLTSSLANASYTWSAPSASISIINENLQDIFISHPGTYSLVVEDITNGCHFATTANVLQDTITPITNITSTGTITCANPTVTLNSYLASMSYTWTSESNMNVSNSQNTIVNQSGTYTLTVLNTLNGCTYKAFVDVIENKHRPNSSFSANPTSGIVPLDVNFTPLNPTSNNDYSWTFGDNYQNTSSSQNPSHVYNDLKTYIVTLDVTDKTSLCQSTSTLAITVYEQPSIIVPNVFTANDDGANDIYKIITKGIVELNMDIYNRWGTKIFSFTGVNDYWDGAESPAGTYFYILSAIGIDDKTYQQQGFITLFK